MIYTVIAKPTKDCNADCSYCASPPDKAVKWTIDEFKKIFDNISPLLSEQAVIIWHGGEPMLMGPDFYRQAYEYAKKTKPEIKFSMQTNILLYNKKNWKSVFSEIMKGRISTSFDPDESSRTVKGSTEKYSRQFNKKLNELIRDGFHPLVIGTYTEQTIDFALKMYEKSINFKEGCFDLRFNYRYPAGRNSGGGAAISPGTFGKMLIEIYNQWIIDCPDFNVTPLDLMLKKCIGVGQGQCPWTRKCGGKFISIEPNGDVFNCGEFADLSDDGFKFGNVKSGFISNGRNEKIIGFSRKPKKQDELISEIMQSHAARLMKRRVFDLPKSCIECPHFKECEGGCMRDAELFDRGLGGKFFYCESWFMVFKRIKESIISGEADGVLTKLGYSPAESKRYVFSNIL